MWATVDCFCKKKKLKAQVPLTIVQYLYLLSPGSAILLALKTPTHRRAQHYSDLISINQCCKPSVPHKFALMPCSESRIHQEDHLTYQNENCRLWEMQTWSLKALQGHDALPASNSGSHRQGKSSGEAVQEGRPHTGKGAAPAEASKGRRHCSAPCITGTRSAASRDSRSSARKKGFICWKSSD